MTTLSKFLLALLLVLLAALSAVPARADLIQIPETKGGLVFGPNGNRYAIYAPEGGVDDAVGQFSRSGALIGSFVAPGTGGLTAPNGLTFGPDKNLYASSSGSDEVLRFNGTTGAFMNVFVSAGSGNLGEPGFLAWGPDGKLYVRSDTSDIDPTRNLEDHILRYNADGSFDRVFAVGGPPPGDPSGLTLTDPNGFVFGPDGKLYVSSGDTGTVLRYASDGSAELFIPNTLMGDGHLSEPQGLAFGPDGHLYVADDTTGVRVVRYDGTTGAFMDVVLPPDESRSPFLAFTSVPEPSSLTLFAGALVMLGFVAQRSSGGIRPRPRGRSD